MNKTVAPSVCNLGSPYYGGTSAVKPQLQRSRIMKPGFPPLLVLLMLLPVWGCAEPQRSYPVRDYPTSLPPSIKETKSLGTSWENEFGLI
jgi:hypothetical protein